MDRISDLPDCVLFYILSFLPTKAVVVTSVLSKRWKHIWRSVTITNLELQCEYYDAFHQLRSYLDSPHHHHHHHLQTLIFRCCSNCFNHNKFPKLVTSAALNRLEYLQLGIVRQYDPMQSWVLPSPLFNSKTLVVFKLVGSNLHLDLQPSCTVHLPSLKILSLRSVGFPPHSLLKLLYGCPNLEDLEALNLYHRLLETDNKILPKLVRADIDLHNIAFELLYNVHFMHIHEMDELESDPEEFIFSSFYNLIHIELDYSGSTKNWFKLLKLLNRCPQLQSFVINESCDDERTSEECDWQYPVFVPECISSQLKTCRLNGYHGSKAEFEFVKYIMENARQLQYMEVRCCCHVDVDPDDEDEYEKHRLIKELSSCTRLSPTCKLLYNEQLA